MEKFVMIQLSSTHIEIMALFFEKSRVIGSEHFDTLLKLDDIWDEVYERLRITAGFGKARKTANIKVINFILGNLV